MCGWLGTILTNKEENIPGPGPVRLSLQPDDDLLAPWPRVAVEEYLLAPCPRRVEAQALHVYKNDK